jgi:hypothetical protein
VETLLIKYFRVENFPSEIRVVVNWFEELREKVP